MIKRLNDRYFDLVYTVECIIIHPRRYRILERLEMCTYFIQRQNEYITARFNRDEISLDISR